VYVENMMCVFFKEAMTHSKILKQTHDRLGDRGQAYMARISEAEQWAVASKSHW
jgi:hypothetical protein